ncbi:MliC family protein [Paludibaculum fermentans]|uniref:MliC family protein n=1 Tax=Paludibaculum fermentans TaxID=1473598 RepID=UPI003EB7CD56
MMISVIAGARRPMILLLGMLLASALAPATDLVVTLPGTKLLSRKVVQYSCDANAVRIGLPAVPFEVEYINGSGNNLATVPILGGLLIFANVSSASGARYAAQQYIWWEAKGSATLYLDSPAQKDKTVCQPVTRK